MKVWKDKFGKEVNPGDCVVVSLPDSAQLFTGLITSIKSVAVVEIMGLIYSKKRMVASGDDMIKIGVIHLLEDLEFSIKGVKNSITSTTNSFNKHSNSNMRAYYKRRIKELKSTLKKYEEYKSNIENGKET